MPLEHIIPVKRKDHFYEVVVKPAPHSRRHVVDPCDKSCAKDFQEGMLEIGETIRQSLDRSCIWMPEAQYETLWALMGGDRDALGYRHMAIHGMPVRLIGDDK